MTTDTSNLENDCQRLIVGTFNTPELFLLNFQPTTKTLRVEQSFEAIGNHSWLGLDKSKKVLLATCWTDPPCIASYSIPSFSKGDNEKEKIELKSTQNIKSRSGYVAVHHLLNGKDGKAYTAGGPSGEVLALNVETGILSSTLQEMNYVTGETFLTKEGKELKGERDEKDSSSQSQISQNKESENVLDFGGLRHGAHSIDLSPDGKLMYVADIGRNCIWVHHLDEKGLIDKTEKIISPRSYDGPRHVWPHPSGQFVYVLQEHSSMVDVFQVQYGQESILNWVQGVRIIPEDQDHSMFWADEVRTVLGDGTSTKPEFLVASTRGLKSETKGYVSLFKLTKEGLIEIEGKGQNNQNEYHQAWLDIWQTPTSGGWANAVEPYYRLIGKGQYIALTDSEEGLVMILTIEQDEGNTRLTEVARVKLGKTKEGKIRGAATAVWL